MLKHSLKDNQIHVSIDKKDFSYRIPVKKIGSTIDWKIGTKGIVIKNVSTWMLQLFTKKMTQENYIKQFKDAVQKYAADNTINWENTFLAVKIQNEYNWLIITNKTAEDKLSEEEIISSLRKKHSLS
ncbi:MAG: hypothetical protein COA33_008025 [Fluviicola sp.]|nr:hypothetical protein [Fluviicola sp.]